MLPLKTKNPTNVGLDVVERVNVYRWYYLSFVLFKFFEIKGVNYGLY